jgi:glutathione reductase (NADPH)
VSKFDYDLFVIGAGSGGVRAARIAASHGARVAIAEEYRVGGTCVIRGCIPKKLLVYGAHFAEDLKDAEIFGWQVGAPAFHWATLRQRVAAEVARLEKLYTSNLRNHHVEIINSRAALLGPQQVMLATGQRIEARYILIATGARPAIPSFGGSELGITSNEVFDLSAVPSRIVVAGGGYIANEFAGIFNELGSSVTVVNRTDQILRGYDEQIRDRLLQISITKGIQFRFHAEFTHIERTDSGSLLVHFKEGASVETDAVLYALGRRPNVSNLGLELAGVELDHRHAIKIDSTFKTTSPSIYAIGDVTDRIQLTPVAIREGQAFADSVFGGRPRTVDYHAVPAAVFSHPPMAGVGLTESQARSAQIPVKICTSDFRPLKNVLADRNERSLYKMVIDAETDVVLGVHMVGPDAPEILQAAAVAVKAKLKKSDFDATFALHPTMAEELVLMR